MMARCSYGVQALLRSRRAGAGTPAAGPAAQGNPWCTGFVSNLFSPKIAVFHAGLLHECSPATGDDHRRQP